MVLKLQLFHYYSAQSEICIPWVDKLREGTLSNFHVFSETALSCVFIVKEEIRLSVVQIFSGYIEVYLDFRPLILLAFVFSGSTTFILVTVFLTLQRNPFNVFDNEN